jgi:probable O-glycosylation ligase (exosortase A-associated)
MYFGYASAGWPVSMAVASCTIVGALMTKERINPFSSPAVVIYALLMLWMTIGLPFSFVPEYCNDLWDRTLKITFMLILTIALLNTRKKLEVFIWANVVSIGYYGVKGGVFSITTGGNAIVLGPGGFTAENNALALAEIVVLPLLRYLQMQNGNKWIRRALGVSMALITVSALASHSRGALLGVVGMAGYFWFKSRNKFTWGLVLVLAAFVALAAMPDEYWQRMSSIKDYEDDGSSQGRINSWWAAFNIANDRITGGGFRTNIGWVYERYAPNPKQLLVEHSIYFQMLGEFGWIGLFLFLAMGALTWRYAQRMIRLSEALPQLKWAGDLGAMVQVSMVGYAITGAFLSLALFDLPYNVMAMSLLGLRFALQEAEAAAQTAAVAAPPARPPAVAGKPPPAGTPRVLRPPTRSR